MQGGTLTVNADYVNSNRYTRVYNSSTLIVNGSYLQNNTNYPFYVYGGGSVEVTGTLESLGNVYSAGVFDVAAGGEYSSQFSTYIQSGGRLTGTGSVQAGSAGPAYQLRVQSGGTVDPGPTSGPGRLTTTDVVFESTAGNFNVQLSGALPGTGYDQLQAGGAVTVAGNLNVTLLSSFAAVGDEFTILNNTSSEPTTGSFNGLPENGLVKYGGNIWSISYQGGDGNDVVLTTQTVNQFPTGNPQTVTTDEEVPVNITLTGSDADGIVTGFSVETSPQFGTLSGTAPNLTYRPNLNFAGTDSFQFRVTDDNDGFGIATITIVVRPIQDVPTNITLSDSSVDENSPAGTTVGMLGTVDPDSNDTFTYAFVSGAGDNDNSLFRISGDQLLLDVTPDYEADSSYTVRIRSTDSAGASVERALSISVLDVNEAPTRLALSDTSVDENVVAGSVIATLTAEDPDAGDAHSYSLVLGPGATDNGRFAIDGNELKIREVPDFESQDTYSIRLRATDTGGLYHDQTLVISVRDLNDQPRAAGSAGATRREGTAVSFDASASSDADGDSLTYLWDFGDGNSGSGVAPSHIYADNGTYTVTLTVADGHGGSDTDELTITVANVAPAVTPAEDVTIELGETFSVSGSFTDPGADNWEATVNYGDGSGDQTLSLNNDQTFELSHDFSDIGTYTVTVTVQDDDGQSDSETLTVVVLRAAAPDLTVSTTNISFSPLNPAPGETVAISATVMNEGLIAATDALVDFYDLETLIGQTTISGNLAPGESATVSITASFADAGFRLITVKADPADESHPNGTIAELNEANNEAGQLLRVGIPDPTAAQIAVQAAGASAYAGKSTRVTGNSEYEFETLLGTQAFPVQGGSVSVRIVDPTSGATVGIYSGGTTDSDGNFRQGIQAPGIVGTYTLIVKVTDGTIIGESTTTLAVTEAPADDDDEQEPTLGVSFSPGTVAENAGPSASVGTVTRIDPDDLTGDLIVTLSSSDTSEANIRETVVVIPDGQYSVTFPIDAVDDDDRDGTKRVVITASTDGYFGFGILTVTDDEPRPDPPPGVPDVFVTSDDIEFSNDNPDLGEEILIFADIHYLQPRRHR